MQRAGEQLMKIALVLLVWPVMALAGFDDPAPPKVNDRPARVEAKQPVAHEGLKFHKAAKALAADAVTNDWPRFLGPSHNATSTETRLLKNLPAKLPIVWEVKKGSGYCSPAIAGGRLVLFHRVGDEEIVECLEADTGLRYWRIAYPTSYRDRYGYNDGPRASPVIDGELVFTMGAEGVLHCLDLASGHVYWKRKIVEEFKLEQNFFGVGSTPLVEGNLLIINVGAAGGPSVAAFDKKTGKMAWGAGDEWGASYASPVPATIHGRKRVLVFAGGESRPPTGGLMCLEPVSGKIDFSFSWRSRSRESVNASAPIAIGNQVFISECYGKGSALVEVNPDFSHKEIWTNADFGTHFMTPIHKDGFIYGIHGHGPLDCPLVCIDAKTGKEKWRHEPEWEETVQTAAGPRKLKLSYNRASLLHVDGRTLVLTEHGHLLWIDLNPNGYKELSRTWLFLASESWTPPALSRGLLFICQNNAEMIGKTEPRLICYDLRETQ
jgi:outer membrane protein assembly factor BamB